MKRDKGVLIVISGPSGSGKGTICKALLDQNKEIKLSISATTRSPREGEVDGVNYFFKDKSEFEKMIEKNDLLEWAEFCGNYYGTPKAYVDEQLLLGNDVILEIEVQGALEVKQKFDQGVFIFVIPPNMTELKERLVKRGTESTEVIEKRLNRALEELELASHYDYIIVNEVIDESVDQILSVIKAEKCKYQNKANIIDILKGGQSHVVSSLPRFNEQNERE